MLICWLILAFWLVLSYDLWEDRWTIFDERYVVTGSVLLQDDSVAATNFLQLKKCKKVTASLILLERGLEFKTKEKEWRINYVEKKKHGTNSQILYIPIYTRLSFLLSFHFFLPFFSPALRIFLLFVVLIVSLKMESKRSGVCETDCRS